MSVTELEAYFKDLFDADLKAIPEKVTTLFDIAGFPQYETVISNFYSFFFNPSGIHGLCDLFISALINLIDRKKKDLLIFDNIEICYSERERCTDLGKYIDILICEPSEIPGQIKNAIIIENKINAAVYNDLIGYYNSVRVDRNKIGVVLSLKKEQNLPDQFINITHKEFINQIELSSGSYFLKADIKQLFLLKEFVQNIKSMTLTHDLKDYYEFYLKHQEKVKEISELYSTIKADIFKQVDNVCEKLDMGLKLQGRYNSQLRYFFSNVAPVYFTVWLEEFFNGEGELSIFVELNGDGIDKLEILNRINFDEDEKRMLKETTKVRKSYIHYATLDVLPTDEDIKDFTNYIYNQINQTPLKSIFLKIERELTK